MRNEVSPLLVDELLPKRAAEWTYRAILPFLAAATLLFLVTTASFIHVTNRTEDTRGGCNRAQQRQRGRPRTAVFFAGNDKTETYVAMGRGVTPLPGGVRLVRGPILRLSAIEYGCHSRGVSDGYRWTFIPAVINWS
jgi:hypothetical protein